jgi:predicted porin
MKLDWKSFAIGLGAAGAVAFVAHSAKAADLSGSCCADLEERIAELEATTARKGNSKVTLAVSGQINKALFYYDADANISGNKMDLGSDTHVIENGVSESYVSFSGKADISPGWSVGYTLEIGQGTTGIALNEGMSGLTDGIATDNDLYTRQSYVGIKNDTFGTVTLGLQSMATDDLSQLNVANTGAASKRLTWQPVGNLVFSVAGIELVDVPLEPFNGRKANAVKYTSPVISGFSASAAWSSDDESWDVALRYATEVGGFQILGAAGYYDDKTNDIVESLLALDPTLAAIGSKTITVNAGIKHVLSGLFVQGTWAQIEFNIPNTPAIKSDAFHVQAGIERKFFPIGKTTIFGEYSEWDDVTDNALAGVSVGLKAYGLGINQQLGDAVDLYATARRHEIDATYGTDSLGVEADVFMTGLRLKF